jgi:hypothetical protein
MFDPVATTDNSNVIALLCVGDVSAADGNAALPLTLLFGQPMIHHMIKSLQRVGITKFVIGVDTVPGALLAYRDAVSKQGLDLRFVREPSAMTPLLDANSRILLLRADTILDVGLIQQALLYKDALVATVEERAENQVFERIDLNSRWAGMAILNRSSIDAMTQLPEGWDMASALLRQALQDGVKSWPIKQTEIQAGNLRRVANAGDLAAAQSTMLVQPKVGATTLEDRLFSKALARFAPKIWSVSWGPASAEFAFPTVAALAALLAIAGFATGAATAALCAVFASLARKFVRSAEYRFDTPDWVGWGSWAGLIVAMIALLKLDEPSLFEAGFLGLTLSGLSLIPAIQKEAARFRLLSPLVIAPTLMLATIAGGAAIAVKILIFSEITAQLLHALRKMTAPKSAD